MAFLLDTMVLSETGKRRKDARAIGWLNAHRSAELYVSVLSIGEIHAGVERKKASAAQFPHQLDAWASALRTDFANRTLDISTPIALRWASLSATLRQSDLDLSSPRPASSTISPSSPATSGISSRRA